MMLRYLFRWRFSYVDIAVVSVASNIAKDSLLLGLAALAVGSLAVVLVEMFYLRSK